jgi:hypothetical protein
MCVGFLIKSAIVLLFMLILKYSQVEIPVLYKQQ